ncbi:hypothetical protein AcV7_008098 [Taiwanofungus camphoratus]|nr:hypothetical protein AcV7_008098 [Antrodia cinnamomea]
MKMACKVNVRGRASSEGRRSEDKEGRGDGPLSCNGAGEEASTQKELLLEMAQHTRRQSGPRLISLSKHSAPSAQPYRAPVFARPSTSPPHRLIHSPLTTPAARASMQDKGRSSENNAPAMITVCHRRTRRAYIQMCMSRSKLPHAVYSALSCDPAGSISAKRAMLLIIMTPPF